MLLVATVPLCLFVSSFAQFGCCRCTLLVTFSCTSSAGYPPRQRAPVASASDQDPRYVDSVDRHGQLVYVLSRIVIASDSTQSSFSHSNTELDRNIITRLQRSNSIDHVRANRYPSGIIIDHRGLDTNTDTDKGAHAQALTQRTLYGPGPVAVRPIPNEDCTCLTLTRAGIIVTSRPDDDDG